MALGIPFVHGGEKSISYGLRKIIGSGIRGSIFMGGDKCPILHIKIANKASSLGS